MQRGREGERGRGREGERGRGREGERERGREGERERGREEERERGREGEREGGREGGRGGGREWEGVDFFLMPPSNELLEPAEDNEGTIMLQLQGLALSSAHTTHHCELQSLAVPLVLLEPVKGCKLEFGP